MKWSCVALALLILPRFFLVPIQDTGIRVEDIVLLLTFPAAINFLTHDRIGMRSVMRGVAFYYAIVIGSCLFAAMSGRLSLGVTIAFGVRPLLYLSAFLVGYELGLSDTERRRGLLFVARYAIYLHVAYGAAAAVGVVPNVASFSPSRLSGLTNGPYELSAMACLVAVACATHRQYRGAAICFLAVLWTQSRIALAALLVHLLISNVRHFRLTRWLGLAIAAVLAIGVMETRSDSSQLRDTWEAFSDLRSEFSEAAKTRDEYFNAVYSDEANAVIVSADGDPSALLRVARWSMVLATAADSPANLLIGMGPSYYSVALDGNYIRLIGETGLLGLAFFLAAHLRVYHAFTRREGRRVVLMLTIQILVVAVFIDIFVSLKTMCLFWMLVGAAKREDAVRDPRKDVAAGA